MKSCACHAAPPARPVALEAMGWIFSTLGLILLPKCPACLAAYVALFTGIGISMSLAKTLQTLLPLVCCLFIVGLLILAARRFWPRRAAFHS